MIGDHYGGLEIIGPQWASLGFFGAHYRLIGDDWG